MSKAKWSVLSRRRGREGEEEENVAKENKELVRCSFYYIRSSHFGTNSILKGRGGGRENYWLYKNGTVYQVTSDGGRFGLQFRVAITTTMWGRKQYIKLILSILFCRLFFHEIAFTASTILYWYNYLVYLIYTNSYLQERDSHEDTNDRLIREQKPTWTRKERTNGIFLALQGCLQLTRWTFMGMKKERTFLSLSSFSSSWVFV